MLLSNLYILLVIIVLFILCSFAAQKTENKIVVKIGITLLIIMFITILNISSILL
jgi:hypothetical protein